MTAISPDALVRQLDRLHADTVSNLRPLPDRRPVRVQQALTDLCLSLDGTTDLHADVLDRLDATTGRLPKRCAAALWACTLRGSDTTARMVEAVADAMHHLAEPFPFDGEHDDGPCRDDAAGYCERCRCQAEAEVFSAHQALAFFLGDTAMDDLLGAA